MKTEGLFRQKKITAQVIFMNSKTAQPRWIYQKGAMSRGRSQSQGLSRTSSLPPFLHWRSHLSNHDTPRFWLLKLIFHFLIFFFILHFKKSTTFNIRITPISLSHPPQIQDASESGCIDLGHLQSTRVTSSFASLLLLLKKTWTQFSGYSSGWSQEVWNPISIPQIPTNPHTTIYPSCKTHFPPAQPKSTKTYQFHLQTHPRLLTMMFVAAPLS